MSVMKPKQPGMDGWRQPQLSAMVLLVAFFCLTLAPAHGEPAAANPPKLANDTTRFDVAAYAIGGSGPLATNLPTPLFATHTGTNVSLSELVQAAAELHEAYREQGHPFMSVAIALERITNGIVTLNPFQTAIPQVVVSGQTYQSFTNVPENVLPEIAAKPVAGPLGATNSAATNAVAAKPTASPFWAGPLSPDQMDQAKAALQARIAHIATFGVDNRIHVASTNQGPRFAVDKYLIMGNTVLPPLVMSQVLTNIDGAYGTNVSFEGIRTAVEELQKSYRERGFVTVSVGLPQQKLTNATVKIQVTEGRVAAINVVGNEYFSSNNIMRALPSLHTNIVLNGDIFQAELNRANGNRDRQIYPVIGPGPEPGTSALKLKVKDQMPVHGKLEFNNQSTPGSPDLRVNASAEADNLWQLEHSLGVQYGFSPETYKPGAQWNLYDLPSVANGSAFYRLPIGNPQPIDQLIDANRGSFGYNEVTHRFNLPPLSGGPNLTVFASRSTIDNGVSTLASQNLYHDGSGNSLDLATQQQDSTVNVDGGLRLSLPLQTSDDFRSTLSGGLDYKHYELSSGKTNIFTLTSAEVLYNPARTNIVVSHNYSPVPYTVNQLDYLPLALSYNAGWKDWLGNATFDLDASVNVWYQSLSTRTYSVTDKNNITHQVTAELNGADSLQYISGSRQTTGHWVVLRPSFSQEFSLYTNWVGTFRADGQWTSEPLISNEQFGIGGVNSVRGYHEGEAFGDIGWHVSLEQQTPAHVVGMVRGGTPLTVRGLAFMDYAAARLLDPAASSPDEIQLWSTGIGLAGSVGSHWQSKFLVSLPLISTALTTRYQPYFNFVLTAQF